MHRLLARITPLALAAALMSAAPAVSAAPVQAPKADLSPTTSLALSGDPIGDPAMAPELGLLFSAAFDDALPEACDVASGLGGYGVNVNSAQFCFNPGSPVFTPDLSLGTLCRSILTPPSGTIVNVAVSRSSAWTLDSAGVARGCIYPSGNASDFKSWANAYRSALTAYRKQGYEDDITALANCDASSLANPCQVYDRTSGQWLPDPKVFKSIAPPPLPTQAAATAVTFTGIASMSAAAYAQAFVKTDGSVIARCDVTIPSSPSSVCSPPASAKPVVRLSAAARHMVALKTDGSVAEWGATTVNGSAGPARAPALVDVVDVAAGDDFAVALLSNGTVTAWGDNSLGQTSVPAGLTGVKAISAGRCHAVALKDDGTVVSWGCNSSGQTAVGGLTGIAAVQALGDSTIAWTGAGSAIKVGSAAKPASLSIPAGTSLVASNSGDYSQSGDQCQVTKYENASSFAGAANAINAPTNVSSSTTPDGSSTWTFTWSSPTDAASYPGFTYQARYSPANGKPGTWSDWAPATSGLQVPKPPNGIVSRFDVRAVVANLPGPKAEVVTQQTIICGGAQTSDVTLGVSRSRVDAPSAVPVLTVVSPTPKSLRVSFAPAAANGAQATTYVVRYSANGTTWSSVPVRGYALTLGQLTGGTTYQIQVTATNASGSSTAATSAQTLTDAVVSSLSTTSVAGRTVGLTWKAAVLPAGSKDKVKDYRVEFSTDGATWTQFQHKPSTKTSMSVTGLAAGTAYQFRVSAIASSGAGAPSPVATATTKTDVPLPVTALLLANVSSTSISATWTPPVDTGGVSITSYTVTTSTPGATVSVVGNSATISNLIAGKAVTVTVVAKNSVGSSTAVSQKITVLGPAAAPTATVQRLATSVVVQWKAPKDTGGAKITGYSVSVSPAGLTAVTAGTKTTVSGLSQGQQVTVTISAITSYGVGVPAVVLAAAQSVPGQAGALAYASKDATRWSISWTPPADTGGLKISGYKVSVSTDGGRTWSTPAQATKSPYVLLKSAGATRLVRVIASNSIGDGAAATLTVFG